MASVAGSAGPVAVGDRLFGKLRVDGVVGKGGMGVVYRAYHEVLAQTVALKVIRSDAPQPKLVERFIREARVCALLKSEHVARIMDAGVLDDGSPYMVMELLEGESLADHLRRQGTLPVTVAVDVVLDAIEALAEAHGRGVVHRDLKPENLFLAHTPDGGTVLKVLDFGVAKVAEQAEPGARSTASGAFLGTPAYSSPEQLKSSRDVDARSDVWALGVILYELLSGKGPFEAETASASFAEVLTHDPPPLPSLRPDVSQGLWEAVAGCLLKDRNARAPNVVALARALAPWGSERGRATAAKLEGPTSAARGVSVIPPAPSSGSLPDTAGDVSPTQLGQMATLAGGDVSPTQLAQVTAVAGTLDSPTGSASSRRRQVVTVAGALLVGGVALIVGVVGARAKPGAPASAAGANAPPAHPSPLVPEQPPAASLGASSGVAPPPPPTGTNAPPPPPARPPVASGSRVSGPAHRPLQPKKTTPAAPAASAALDTVADPHSFGSP